MEDNRENLTSIVVIAAPVPTAWRSPIVSLTVIERKGTPFAVLRTAAKWVSSDNLTFSSGLAKTCIGSGH